MLLSPSNIIKNSINVNRKVSWQLDVLIAKLLKFKQLFYYTIRCYTRTLILIHSDETSYPIFNEGSYLIATYILPQDNNEIGNILPANFDQKHKKKSLENYMSKPGPGLFGFVWMLNIAEIRENIELQNHSVRLNEYLVHLSKHCSTF